MNILSGLTAAAQDELAAWLGGLSQGTRLLRLHLPSSSANSLNPIPPLVPERLHAREAMLPGDDPSVCGFKLDLTAVSARGDLDLAALLAQPARVDLLLAEPSLQHAPHQALRPFHGRITEASRLDSDGGLTRYRLVIEPWLAFLAQRRDSFVFQDLTVPQIIESVLGDYTDSLGAAWRFDLLDAAAYPRRSLCVQHDESDLDFVLRLLREEGMFAWFEHAADEGGLLGTHTLVIADHNDALQACSQPTVRYTQAGPTLQADALQRFTRRAAVAPARVAHASHDYRTLSQRPACAQADAPAALQADLAQRDQPGAYAWQDSVEAQRLAQRQLEALRARATRSNAAGTVRALGPGMWFTLLDHGSVADNLAANGSNRFAVLSVEHSARNNVGADQHNHGDEPLYANHADIQPFDEAVRPSIAAPRVATPLDTFGSTLGVQTAVVVGLGAPIHTDRDHRIKVQFHWQRGANSSSRLAHPTEDHAPGDASVGTWVRVAEALAGPNWGANFTPRVGQEVLVDFIEGDIERPIVIGSVYNGAGAADAPGNHVASGGAGTTGNAPAWFPGNEKAGSFDGHAHAAALSGFKTQELANNAGGDINGSSGHNHLVLDDTPGQSRVTLGTTQAATHLSIGHLINQSDNQRLQPRGHGLELTTTAWGAVRAGQALQISTHAQAGGSTSTTSHSQDSHAAQDNLRTSAELQSTLTRSAQAQRAKTSGEPARLPATDGIDRTTAALSAVAGQEASEANLAQGGLGATPAPTRPDLLLASPAGITAHTPQHHIATAGATLSLTTGQDINLTAQGHLATAAKDGIVIYTVGEAQDVDKPNQETGIKLHAASGSVSLQAQNGALNLNAQDAVAIDSTQGSVRISAPSRIQLVGAGSALEIDGADITLTTPGAGAFHAAMKEWASGASTRPVLPLLVAPRSLAARSPDAHDQFFVLRWANSGRPMNCQRFSIRRADGRLQAGTTDAAGRSPLLDTASQSERLTVQVLRSDIRSA